MLGNLGWQYSFNRFFALARRQDDPGELRGLMTASGRINLLGASVAAVVLVLAAVFTQRLAFGLLAAAVLTVPYAVMMLRRQQLAGTRQSPAALMLDQGLASLVLLAAVLLAPLGLTEMLAVYAAAMVAGNLGAIVLVRRKLPAGLRDATPRYEWRTWIRVSLTLMQARLARVLVARIDVILLPALAGLAATGLYGAAFRVTYVMSFAQFVQQTINGPQFAEAFAAGKPQRVQRILKRSIAFAVVTSLPWLVLFLAFPRQVITVLFGAEFAEAAGALGLIATGQFALSLSAPFNALLVSGGQERKMAVLSYSILIGAVVLGFLLIPPLGATGAAAVFAIFGFTLLVGQALLGRLVLKRL
jgi:O-antigen/teichoic acid export membrane protein